MRRSSLFEYTYSQELEPGSKEAAAELAEVRDLQQQQLAAAVGLPGLRLAQDSGAGVYI